MKNTLLFLLFISVIVILFAFAFSFSQSSDSDGQQIFLDSKCAKCHSVESLGITSNKDDAVDLSNTGQGYDAELLKKYLLREETINGKNHKLKFTGTEDELNNMVNWLLSIKTSDPDTGQ